MSETLQSTPIQDGYRMPGEFEAHTGCWMLWPERPDNWRNGAKPAQHAFVQVATAISQFEAVTVGVSQTQFNNARQRLPVHIRLVELSYNDAWMRDCGPTFVVDDHGRLRGVDWEFNAWGGLQGGLYFPWDLDDLVARKVLEIERAPRYKAPLVLEGGSIEVDGQGTLLATEECLLHPNRNPGLTRGKIEALLREYLSVERILWLEKGVYLDETNGHIDNLARFIRPGVVVLTWTDNHADPQYDISRDAYRRLAAATDARGRRLEVHKIHQPNPITITAEESEGVDAVEGTLPRQGGDRLAASYVNFYLANGGLILPGFGDEHDSRARDALQALLPERRIVMVPGREILLGGGNIHCITQQQPQGGSTLQQG